MKSVRTLSAEKTVEKARPKKQVVKGGYSMGFTAGHQSRRGEHAGDQDLQMGGGESFSKGGKAILQPTAGSQQEGQRRTAGDTNEMSIGMLRGADTAGKTVLTLESTCRTVRHPKKAYLSFR